MSQQNAEHRILWIPIYHHSQDSTRPDIRLYIASHIQWNEWENQVMQIVTGYSVEIWTYSSDHESDSTSSWEIAELYFNW